MLRPKTRALVNARASMGSGTSSSIQMGRAGRRAGSRGPYRKPERWRCRPASTTSPPTQPSVITSATSGISEPCGCLTAGRVSGSCCISSRRHPGSTVWVNETEVVSHEVVTRRSRWTSPSMYPRREGPDHRRRGQHPELAVDPPGVIEDTPAGKRRRYWHDFFNYGGIHRNVWLYATNPAHFTDVTIMTDLDGAAGVISYTAEADNTDSLQTRVILRDAHGAEVASGSGLSGTLNVSDVHKWAPGDGYLYDLELQLVEGDTVVDSYPQSVGVRTVQVDGIRFLINGGAHLLHRGSSSMKDVPVIGKGHNDTYLLRLQAAQMDRCQLVPHLALPLLRRGHRLRRPARDRADRRDSGGWPQYGPRWRHLRWPGRRTFSSETANDATREVHAQAIRELIAATRTTPAWCCGASPTSRSPTPRARRTTFAPCSMSAREADPRPVGFVNVMLAPHGKCRVSQFGDVLMLNRYYGWYVNTGDLAAAELAWEEELTAWAGEGKPIIITEYGADTYPGLHSLAAENRGVRNIRSNTWTLNHRVFDRIDAVVGEQVWNFADFTTTSGIMRVGGNKKGVFTHDRQPKAAAHYLRGRWRKTSDSQNPGCAL